MSSKTTFFTAFAELDPFAKYVLPFSEAVNGLCEHWPSATHVLPPNSAPHPATCSVIEKTNTVILMLHNVVFQQHEKVVLLKEYFEFFP